MPSLTYGVRFGAWKSRSVLVSFSVKSSAADALRGEKPLPEVRVRGGDHAGGRLPEPRAGRLAAPRPGVAEPEGRQHVERRRLRAAVGDGDLDEEVLRRRLRVLDEHVEVAIVVEHARVQQLVLEVVAAPAAVLLDEPAVGILRLRVLVEVLHVRVGRRRVEVEVVLLDVLAVIPLAVGQPEQALLEDRVLPVPEREREAEELPVVGDAGQPVLAPAVGARARLVVAEVAPGVAVVAVVLADRPPLALGEVGTPLPPGHPLSARLLQAIVFGVRPRLRLAAHGRSPFVIVLWCSRRSPPLKTTADARALHTRTPAPRTGQGVRNVNLGKSACQVVCRLPPVEHDHAGEDHGRVRDIARAWSARTRFCATDPVPRPSELAAHRTLVRLASRGFTPRRRSAARGPRLMPRPSPRCGIDHIVRRRLRGRAQELRPLGGAFRSSSRLRGVRRRLPARIPARPGDVHDGPGPARGPSPGSCVPPRVRPWARRPPGPRPRESLPRTAGCACRALLSALPVPRARLFRPIPDRVQSLSRPLLTLAAFRIRAECRHPAREAVRPVSAVERHGARPRVRHVLRQPEFVFVRRITSRRDPRSSVLAARRPHRASPFQRVFRPLGK